MDIWPILGAVVLWAFLAPGALGGSIEQDPSNVIAFPSKTFFAIPQDPSSPRVAGSWDQIDLIYNNLHEISCFRSCKRRVRIARAAEMVGEVEHLVPDLVLLSGEIWFSADAH
jgi:hypothetical protein